MTCVWCSKSLAGRRKGTKFCDRDCRSDWLAATEKAKRHAAALADGRTMRQGDRSPDGLCLLPSCRKKLTGKQTRYCKYAHGIEHRDSKRPPRIAPDERARRIAGAVCALEECGAPVPPERAMRALRSKFTRFFCKPEHRERYWIRHGERKRTRKIDPYMLVRALVPEAASFPYSPEAKAAVKVAEAALTTLRDALRRSQDRFDGEVQAHDRDPKKLTAARDAYARGVSGLRGAARVLGVTAPTFADLLRRLGDEIRTQKAAASAPVLVASARSITEPLVGKPVARPVERSLPRVAKKAPSVRQRATRSTAPEDHEARRRIADVLRGAVKLPTKELTPIGSTADQVEWDRCRSWRRMLIGARWAKHDPIPIILAFVAAARSRAHGTTPRVIVMVERELSGAAKTGPEALYRLCAMACDGFREVLPSRSSVEAENAFCDVFRAKLPTAPKEFSTVGH